MLTQMQERPAESLEPTLEDRLRTLLDRGGTQGELLVLLGHGLLNEQIAQRQGTKTISAVETEVYALYETLNLPRPKGGDDRRVRVIEALKAMGLVSKAPEAQRNSTNNNNGNREKTVHRPSFAKQLRRLSGKKVGFGKYY